MSICCDDCGEPLAVEEATLLRLKRSERLCDDCWGARLQAGSLPVYYNAIEESARIADALLEGLLRKESS